MRTTDAFLCDIKFAGLCEGNATSAWLCQVEQTEVAACRPCRAEWMRLTSSEPDLRPRCPRCTKLDIKIIREKPRDPGPITGLVADAVNEAMRIEGVLINVRQSVLKRLARDAAWLDGWGGTAGDGAKVAGQRDDDAAAPAGRAGGEVGALGPAQRVAV